jgi:hypothetical protein
MTIEIADNIQADYERVGVNDVIKSRWTFWISCSGQFYKRFQVFN